MTPEQLRAINCNWKSVGVMAGAGTGKTATLVGRVKRLLSEGCDPEEIAVFTFTRNAADEMRERLGKVAARCWIGTYHNVAYRLMPTKPYVLSEQDALKVLSECVPTSRTLSYWRKHVDAHRTNLRVARDGFKTEDITNVTTKYTSKLNLLGAIDFHGLLLWLADYSRSWQVKHIIVDEAQDNEPLQWEIVDNLMDSGASGWFCGDFSQMLYLWRGVRPEDFAEHCYNQLELSHTFRLPVDVCAMANTLAKRNDLASLTLTTQRTERGLSVERNVPVAVVKALMDDESFTENDIMVITRTNARRDQIEAELTANGLRVSKPIAEDGIYTRLLRCLAYPSVDAEWLAETLGWPKDYPQERIPLWLMKHSIQTASDALAQINFGPEHAEEKDWLNNYFGGLSIIDCVNEVTIGCRDIACTKGIRVLNTHQSKGLEAPATVLAFDEVYQNFSPEMHRIRYVATTRAKERCAVLDGDVCLVEDALKAGAVDNRQGIELENPF